MTKILTSCKSSEVVPPRSGCLPIYVPIVSFFIPWLLFCIAAIVNGQESTYWELAKWYYCTYLFGPCGAYCATTLYAIFIMCRHSYDRYFILSSIFILPLMFINCDPALDKLPCVLKAMSLALVYLAPLYIYCNISICYHVAECTRCYTIASLCMVLIIIPLWRICSLVILFLLGFFPI
jgi:hypothetical protein